MCIFDNLRVFVFYFVFCFFVTAHQLNIGHIIGELLGVCPFKIHFIVCQLIIVIAILSYCSLKMSLHGRMSVTNTTLI